MEKVLTENQRMLAGYLVAVGCSRATATRIIFNTWEPDQTIKMLEFCHDNPNATEAQLLEMSSKISSKSCDGEKNENTSFD
ncbi:MAG: hypothetical protein J6A69_02090 [Clostridia bacterium]|nr:hypothetical protein [Clostridia bacterium]